MSSNNKILQKESMNESVNNQVPLVTGVFAQPIIKRYIDTGIPMSTIPLRTPGCYNSSYNKQGLTEIPYTERARCKCQKAKCLRLYCECFARCFQCDSNCQCELSCQNNDHSEENREKRNQTIMDLIKKDPLTFRTGVKRKLQHQNSKNEGNNPFLFTDVNSDEFKKRKALEMNDKPTIPLVVSKNDGYLVMPGIAFQTISREKLMTTESGGRMSNARKSSKEILAKRIVDEMDRMLFAKEMRQADEKLSTTSFARNVLSKVQSHVKQMLDAGDDAERELRKDIESHEANDAVRSPAHVCESVLPSKPDDKKIIPVGTRFTKSFDILGVFEGLVVDIPNDLSPYYQVEYEDGGSEALLHHTLEEVLLKSELEHGRPPTREIPVTAPKPTTVRLSKEALNELEAKVNDAREGAYQETCVAIFRASQQPQTGVDDAAFLK